MNQNTSFHAHTTAGYVEWSLFRESRMIELHLLACQAVDSVKKTTFLPGKLPGQLTTHSYRPHLTTHSYRPHLHPSLTGLLQQTGGTSAVSYAQNVLHIRATQQ